MMKGALQSIGQAIGNTPIIKLNNIGKNLSTEIYVKAEFMNPCGSVKERMTQFLVDQAEKEGVLRPGGTIIEATSGNTGIGLAMVAAVRGYRCILCMTDKQSPEKINILKALGAEIVTCPYNVLPNNPESYYSVAKRLSEEIPNSFYANQYYNKNNYIAHYEITGPEILRQTGGEFDVFIAGIGTGGTISGTAKFLKEHIPNLKVVAVDIKGSILPHYFKTKELSDPKPYVLEGLGEDIIPDCVLFDQIDEFIVVEDQESMLMTRRLVKEEAMLAGMSSGATVLGSLKYAQANPFAKRILTILPDSGTRYLGKVFNDDWMKQKGYL